MLIEDKIKELDKIRKDFVANVSHELRTPLTVLIGYLEILMSENELDQHSISEIYKQMIEHSNRMHNLVKNLLLLSSLEFNKKSPSIEVINMSSIVENFASSCKEIYQGKTFCIKTSLDESLGLLGNIQEAKSLITNLIMNALIYTDNDAEIFISWKKNKNNASFSVKDNGIGIEEKHIPRLTERFYRVDDARRRSVSGTGLGLAIVKHILMKYQGTLEIKSALGHGSEFICIFPPETLYQVTQ